VALSVPSGSGANCQFYPLGYNPAGLLVSRAASNAIYDWPSPAAFSDGYSVNGLNQYVTARGASLTHDARGNTTNGGTKAYAYDGLNRLVSASNGAAAVSDPSSRLLSLAQGGTTTRFLYDGARLIGEYSGGSLVRRYVHGPGVDQPIVWYDGSGTANRHWLYADERGSVIASEIGSTVAINRYDEYGVPAAAMGSKAQPLRSEKDRHPNRQADFRADRAAAPVAWHQLLAARCRPSRSLRDRFARV
jgi:hypothetical protein